jgi:hypothetical protein
MSLLTTASPWTNDDSQSNKKRTSTMRNTIKNIPTAQPYSETTQDINDKNLEPPSIQESQSIQENRTLKINDLLGKMALSVDNDGNKLGNFSPPERPVVNTKKPDIYDKTAENKEMSPYDLMPKVQTNVDMPSSMNPYAAPTKANATYRANESTGALGVYNNYNASYDVNNVSYKPYYAKMGNSANMPLDNRLLEKINYMIHLLEEQQVEKSSNITEEFILYTFLGIFVIFVVDSFSRSGKYVR